MSENQMFLIPNLSEALLAFILKSYKSKSNLQLQPTVSSWIIVLKKTHLRDLITQTFISANHCHMIWVDFVYILLFIHAMYSCHIHAIYAINSCIVWKCIAIVFDYIMKWIAFHCIAQNTSTYQIKSTLCCLQHDII